MWRTLWALPRTVWLIAFISLMNDSASEMVYPLIPIYFASVLMAGPRALGIMEGIAEATAALLKLFSGVVVDRRGRAKEWVVFGYGVAAVARPFIALVSSWPWLLGLRFLDRVGKGLRTSPRDAILAQAVSAENRGLAFGFHRAMDNAGAVIGPLAAWLLLSAGVSMKDVFLWAALPGALCVALALALREPKANVIPPGAPKASPFDWRLGDMPPSFRRYMLVVALFTLGNSSNMFLLLRARELGVSQAHIPLLWGGVSLVAMLFSTPLSALSDRLGRVRLLVVGYAAYGFFYLAMGFIAGNGAALFALFAFYGIFMAATEGVEKALVADLAPDHRRGTAFGWFNLTAGIMLLPASILFGALYQGIGPAVAFAFSATCAMAAALLLMFWVKIPARAGQAG
ncbi:MFS transporter [candidate division BRC1 bacterium HGW-BRC1-1]|nr:MAG: MFS transporter [candidate division BRC1 bacterium HGW-BRC1-1]